VNKASLFKLDPGTLLDNKYRIDDIIGSGGMGFVYKAQNIVLKRDVAIKTLQARRDENKDSLRRFQQEAQIAASIGQDNICEVIDFGTHHTDDDDFDVYYLVMPLLSGQSLGDWFESWVIPSPSIFIDIISQTLLGLHAAHEKKIVHRDLKPDNIFITRIGDRDNFVKILDFGISKYLESEAALNLTRTGIAMGTPLYMSPEQAKGSRNIDYAADLYAVGVVLYEGFVGQLPYTGDSFNEVLLKIATNPYVAPRKANPHVPLEIESVILKAMSHASRDRYVSALQMRQALLRAAALANIDARKSFVYPPSNAPKPISTNIRTLDIKSPTDGGTTRDNGRRRGSVPADLLDTDLKITQTGANRIPAVLIGIIVLSLIAVAIGVFYIILKRTPQTESANILAIEPLPDKVDASAQGGSINTRESSQGSDERAKLLPAVQLDVVPSLKADIDESAISGIDTVDDSRPETISEKKTIGAVKTGVRKSSHVAQPAAQPEAEDPEDMDSPGNAAGKEQRGPDDASVPPASDNSETSDTDDIRERTRLIERDATSIFD
jgi:serine/threonine protein kinase